MMYTIPALLSTQTLYNVTQEDSMHFANASSVNGSFSTVDPFTKVSDPPSPIGIKSLTSAQTLFQHRIVPAFYIILCLVGLLGNGVVIHVLWTIMKKTTLRSVTDILVINLAVADFIFVGSLPFWATERFLYSRWVFGTFGCKFLSFITLLNLYGSVFFLVAMGIDRYLAVVYAVRARNYRTPRNALIACIVIWSFASLIGMEALIFREVRPMGKQEQCVWDFPMGNGWITAFFVQRVLLGFVLPFLVIVYCYILIMVKLHKRARSSRLTGSSMTNNQQKITRAILAVISLFVVCWLPNHIVTVINAVFNIRGIKVDITTANLVSVCLAYANSSINPILYAFMKEEIRQKGREMIIRFFPCCKSGSESGNGEGRGRFRLSKISFWRSTGHTMLVLAPTNVRRPANDEAQHSEENGRMYPRSPDQEEMKSKDSLDVPTPPVSTDARSDCMLDEVLSELNMKEIPKYNVIVRAHE